MKYRISIWMIPGWKGVWRSAKSPSQICLNSSVGRRRSQLRTAATKPALLI